jgi:glycosyltransferase involved in cell wall biosynthesis
MISIVTVVYNGQLEVENTILSVLNQTYPHIQFIVIDGASTDKTVEIIGRYASSIDVFISEPDSGIYNAMNKAIALCKGKWINFMNVGDVFYTETTLEEVFSNKNHANAIALYGNHEVSYGQSKIMRSPNPLTELWKGMTIQHQSIFVQKTILEGRLFDLQYRFAADFDLIYDLYKKNLFIKYVNIPISTVSANGFSEENSIDTYKEFWSVVNKYEKKTFFIGVYYRFILIERFIVKFLKILFPSFSKALLKRIAI